MKRSRTCRKYVVLSSALALASLASTAIAQTPPPSPPPRAAGDAAPAAAQTSDEGNALYKARDYKGALAKFKQAYAQDPDPNLLYNIARCQEALGDTRAAQENYETFLAQPGGDPDGRVRAQAALQRLRSASSAGANGSAPVADARPATADQPREPDRARGSGPYGTLAIVALATGVVAGAAGTVFYVLGANDHAKVTSAPGYDRPGQVDPMTESEARDLVDSGRWKKTVGIVGWAVGGTALVMSGIFALVNGKRSAEAQRVLHPTLVGAIPAPGGGSVWLSRSF